MSLDKASEFIRSDAKLVPDTHCGQLSSTHETPRGRHAHTEPLRNLAKREHPQR